MNKAINNNISLLIISILVLISTKISSIQTISTDIPLPWGMYFQDGMNAISNGIVELHGYLFYYLVFILCGVTFILFAIIVDKRAFAYKYVTHHTGLEVVWTAVPILILSMIGIPSLDLLYLSDISATERPFEPVTVKVTGNQWYWTYNYNFDASEIYEDPKFWEYVKTYTTAEDQDKIFTAIENNELKLDNNITYEYDSYLIPTSDLEEGQLRLLEVDNKLYIPLDEPVKFLITASDVLHDFAVPALGIKIDCNPGRLNSITVKSNRVGIAYGQCSELCGVGHSEMPIAVHTLTSYEWSNFMYYHTLKNLLDNLN